MRSAGGACLRVWGLVPERYKFISKSFKKSLFSQFACLIGSAATSFSSVWGTGAKFLHSVLLVQFIQFSLRTLPALLGRSSMADPEKRLREGLNSKEVKR